MDDSAFANVASPLRNPASARLFLCMVQSKSCTSSLLLRAPPSRRPPPTSARLSSMFCDTTGRSRCSRESSTVHRHLKSMLRLAIIQRVTLAPLFGSRLTLVLAVAHTPRAPMRCRTEAAQREREREAEPSWAVVEPGRDSVDRSPHPAGSAPQLWSDLGQFASNQQTRRSARLCRQLVDVSAPALSQLTSSRHRPTSARWPSPIYIGLHTVVSLTLCWSHTGTEFVQPWGCTCAALH